MIYEYLTKFRRQIDSDWIAIPKIPNYEPFFFFKKKTVSNMLHKTMLNILFPKL